MPHLQSQKNLKLILKGKILGKSQEEISAFFNMHAEELAKQRDIVVKALVAKDLEEAVSSLGSSPFSDEIQKAVELYNETKNIQAFDIYFDKTAAVENSIINHCLEFEIYRLIANRKIGL